MHNNFTTKTYFVLLFIITSVNSVLPQYPQITFERIGKDQGLIPGNVNDILQDSTGFLWLATENGLCRYDGYSFIYFKNQVNDLSSLSYNHVFSLLEDKNGIIWVGTLGGGLNKFNSRTGKFQRYMNDPADPGSISSNIIFKVYRDSQKRIWISTLGGGLNLFDPVNGIFKRYTHSKDNPNSISSNMVSALYEDREKNFWIGTFDGGMNLFIEQENKFTHFKNNPLDVNSLSHNQVMEFLEDDKGRFWVATFGGGVNLFDIAKKKFSSIRSNSNFPIKPDNLNVRKLLEDQESIWVGTYNGLFRFDKKTFEKTDLYSNANDQKTINDNKIRSIFRDETGVVWVGTIVGLNKFDMMKKKFQIINFNDDYKNFLDNLKLVPSRFISEKILWAGPGKSTILKSNNRKLRFFGKVDESRGFNTLHSSSFYLDESNYLWVWSYNGIHYYDATKDEFHNVQYVDDGTPSQRNNFVRWFYIDRRNRFWAGTMAGGLNFYDPGKDLFKRFIHNEADLNSLGDSRVSFVLEDSHGIIWIGTYGGLDIINEKEGTFKHYRVIPNDSTCISNDRVNSIYESKSGDLWIGTYQGLNRYNRTNDNFEQFTTDQGLGDNTILSIQEDGNGNLWLRTNDGISKFDPVNRVFKNYNANDGLPLMELNGNISLVNNDGKMFFGFSNGLIHFYPDEIKDNPFKPRIVFTRLTIMDEEVSIGENSPLTKPINNLDELELSYKDKIIGIEFSALHYSIPMKNKYAYTLEGFIDKWVFVDANNRVAKFTNLDPGEYILKVKASNNDGIWSDTERSIRIIITPPYWETWWFRITLLILFLLLIFLFYEMRLNKLIGIEHTRARIARNLHDEVGGTLSSIQYFVRAIEKESSNNDQENRSKYLNLIMKSSADAQEKIKDLIWTVNPAEDGLGKFLVKFNRYASDLFDSKEINYNIELPGGIINKSISMEKRQHLWCICKETITNIIKHSQCKNVVVKFHFNGKVLDLLIEDDGIGFVESEKYNNNGLTNIKNRADALKADYNLTTDIGQGTKWYFSIRI
ncbi:MAG: two-component regulator propeller domain-containing protein [Melioribacteraceae bacterium]|nr:two-component regulator propeller domain-containing protein [Melioribacteraceae bacterium]